LSRRRSSIAFATSRSRAGKPDVRLAREGEAALDTPAADLAATHRVRAQSASKEAWRPRRGAMGLAPIDKIRALERKE
jgi:hypothetical protein